MTDDSSNDASSPGETEIRALVAAAQDVPNPLDGLVDKAKAEAGYPFRPEIIEALKQLRDLDRSAFETLRAQLRRVGVRVADLDAEIYKSLFNAADDAAEGVWMAGTELCRSLDAMRLFHTPDGRTFADVDVNGHRETLAVEGKDFADRLAQLYFTATAEAASSEDLRNTVSLARARGKYDGAEQDVHVRVAAAGGNYFLDLGDPDWRAVEITCNGWQILNDPPVRFVRYPGYLSLPTPQGGGSIELLRKHVNLNEDDDFVLAVSWLLSALRPIGPFPVLAVNGEQGSAKSTLSRCLRALVDPNVVPLRALPKSDHDLMISATRAHVVAYDNISRISSEMSDALCRLCTGGGFTTRSLYTDADETLLKAQRPVLLNGIDDVIARPDLAQRTIALELRPIPAARRRPVELIEQGFDGDQPLILGALLDAMVYGLRNLDDTAEASLPRMADAARWMFACEGAFWLEGTVSGALERNAQRANDRLVERMPLVTAIVELLKAKPLWEGTASQLLALLSRLVDEPTRRSREWPQSPAQLGHLLRNRLRPLLRESTVEISGGPRGHDRQRVITLKRTNVDSAASITTEQGTGKESSRSDGDA